MSEAKRSIPASALRRALVLRGLTQADLARMAGLDKNTICRALDDSLGLTLRTENRILTVLAANPVDPVRARALGDLAS